MKVVIATIISICVFYAVNVVSTELTVEDFIAKPGMISASISPNGKYIASVWNSDDERVVMVYDIDANKMITKFGDNIIRPFSVSWANDNRMLIKLLVPYKTSQVRRDSRNKDDFDIDDYFMFGRLVSTDITGDGLVELMNDERSAKRNVNLSRIPHYLPDDKNHILMSSKRKEKLALFKVNVNSGDSELLITGGRHTIDYLIDENGNVLYRYDYLKIAKVMEIFELTTEGDWNLVEEIYFDEDEQSKNDIKLEDLAGLYQDKLVYRKMNEETGFNELLTVDGDETSVLVSLPNTDIVGVITDSIDSEIIGYRTLDDVFRAHYFDEKLQARYDAAEKYFKEENFAFTSVDSEKSRAVVVSSGVNNPFTYHTYDLVKDEMKTLNYAYHSLPRNQLADGVKIQYLSRDNAVINSYITLPPEFDGTRLMPLVVMPHGGPQARDFLRYDKYAQFIATRGYIVIQPNFRGSKGYGKAFAEAGYKQWGGVMQEDLEDVVAYLVGEQLVDPNRVCIVGASYGGYAALMGAVKTPEMYQCAISISGVTHLPEQIEHDMDKFDSEKVRQYILDSIGDPETDMTMLSAKSPALHADKIKIPILLIHGDEDEVVPIDQTEMMFDVLEDTNNYVRMITLKETGHNTLYYKEDIQDVFEETEAFLSTYLPTNKQLDEPAKKTN